MQNHSDTDYYLCEKSDLPEQGSKGFDLTLSGRHLEIFVVRQRGKVYGYMNSCPHTGAPLEWQPNQFLDLDKTRIQCANHDAKFRIEDGFCVSGPCAGQSLTPVTLALKGESIYLVQEKEIKGK